MTPTKMMTCGMMITCITGVTKAYAPTPSHPMIEVKAAVTQYELQQTLFNITATNFYISRISR